MLEPRHYPRALQTVENPQRVKASLQSCVENSLPIFPMPIGVRRFETSTDPSDFDLWPFCPMLVTCLVHQLRAWAKWFIPYFKFLWPSALHLLKISGPCSVRCHLGHYKNFDWLIDLCAPKGWTDGRRNKDFSLGPRPNAGSRDEVLGEGQQPPPHQLGGLESAVSSPSAVPTAERFSTIFTTHDCLFWQYNIVKYGLSCNIGEDPAPLNTPLRRNLCNTARYGRGCTTRLLRQL